MVGEEKKLGHDSGGRKTGAQMDGIRKKGYVCDSSDVVFKMIDRK